MKITLPVSLLLSLPSINAAVLQPRHYTFPSLSGTSAWSSVRQTLNYQSNAGVTDVSSLSVRCYTGSGSRGAPNTQSVAAGSSVSFTASPNIFHPGPLQFYLAKVPEGQSVTSWDGSGNVWFKIYAEQAQKQGSQLNWASLSESHVAIVFFLI